MGCFKDLKDLKLKHSLGTLKLHEGSLIALACSGYWTGALLEHFLLLNQTLGRKMIIASCGHRTTPHLHQI